MRIAGGTEKREIRCPKCDDVVFAVINGAIVSQLGHKCQTTSRRDPLDFPGSQAAYFRNHLGRHLCEVLAPPCINPAYTWVIYPDDDRTHHHPWQVPTRDLTPIGPTARALLQVRR